jgi:alkylhydroperoxidase family enzyme
VRSDYRTAPIDERLRATLALVQKLTLDPDGVTEQDVEAARAAGAGDDALADAITICGLFNMIVRLADSLAFHVPGPEVMAKHAPGMFKRGYRLPGLELQPAPSAP